MTEEINSADVLVSAAIVDDDEDARSYARMLLEGLVREEGMGLTCREYPSGMAFMLEPPSQLDLLLTDIDMLHANGLQVAAFAHEHFSDVAIVLITAFEEYAVDGYSVHARRYLLKPVNQERFRREVGPLLREITETRADSIAVRLPNGVRAVKVRDILYIATAQKKNIEIATRTEKIRVRGSIAEWEELLDATQFFRCHSGFLVNLGAVRRVGNADIELIDGEELPLSKHRRRLFLEAFAAYMGKVL